MTDPILKVKNLNVSLDGVKILNDLNFTVNKKDVFIILGPNGAGKTTLLRSLIGSLPYDGEIKWGTKKISYLPPQEFLQRKNLPPLSIREFFQFKNVSEDKIIEVLKDVNLDPNILDKQFGALSTGQFQRMLIAWSVAGDSDVLLFDEATSGIDIGGEETIYTLLHKLWKERGLTIILVTHDLSVVWEHCTKVLCLNKEYTCMGTPEEILTPEKLKELYGANIKFYQHRHNND